MATLNGTITIYGMKVATEPQDDKIEDHAHTHSYSAFRASQLDFKLGDPINFDAPEQHAPSPLESWFDDCIRADNHE